MPSDVMRRKMRFNAREMVDFYSQTGHLNAKDQLERGWRVLKTLEGMLSADKELVKEVFKPFTPMDSKRPNSGVVGDDLEREFKLIVDSETEAETGAEVGAEARVGVGAGAEAGVGTEAGVGVGVGVGAEVGTGIGTATKTVTKTVTKTATKAKAKAKAGTAVETATGTVTESV
jgi:hypothetical protein